jgi:hypothetical protein
MLEEHPSEFEDRLRAVLSRTAEAIPPDVDVSARVRRALVRPQHRPRFLGIAGPRNMLGTVVAVLVVVLLVAALTFAHPRGVPRPDGGQSAQPTNTATTEPAPTLVPLKCVAMYGVTNPSQPTGTPVDHSIAVGRSASAQGITITIDRVYADATETLVTYHMQTNLNPPLPALPVLIDAHGNRYAYVAGDWDVTNGGSFSFAPLPSDELGTQQTLTFLAQQMRLADPTGPGALVDGPWSVSFDVTPAAGTSAVLSTSAVVHDGLSVQPLQIDVAPAGGGLLGIAGGARVVVRISGLSPSMRLRDLDAFDTALAPGGHSFYCGGGILELVLPNGQQIAPGVVTLLGQTVPETVADEGTLVQTVGPSGTVDIEALFYLPIQSAAGLTLYIDHLNAQPAGATQPQRVSGPWEFHLP